MRSVVRALPVALLLLLAAVPAAARAADRSPTFVPLAAIKPDSTDDVEISAATPDGKTIVSERRRV